MALAVDVHPTVLPQVPTMVAEPSVSQPLKIFRTAVVLKKTTRWDYEREKHSKKSEAELLRHLRGKGINVEHIRQNDKKQKDALREIVFRLERAGISTRVVNRHELASAVRGSDLIVSAGGDGTFLTAAAAVTDQTPVIGINTDPIGSEGHLCICGKYPPTDLIERIVDGKFKYAMRNRIRVSILNGNSNNNNRQDILCPFMKKEQINSIQQCTLALNEVFIGEDEAAKVSTYEISIDDAPMVKQKSSGLIVSTGTGSTSWYYGMNRVEEQSVTQVLEVLQSMGIDVNANKKEIASEVAKRINDKITFEPDHPNFAFSIREPIFNETFERTAVRGFARRIRLRSKCSKGYLVLDGSNKIPFNYGTEVLLEIVEQDALRTITL